MMEFFEQKRSQVFWIGIVIVCSFLLMLLSIFFSSEATKTDVEEIAKLVRYIEVEKETRNVVVSAQGVVKPDREISLRSEVSGRVVERAQNMVEGGLVKAGEILVKIDPRDYQNAVEQARAAYEKAKFDLEIERGRQVIAKREWDQLSPTIKTSDISEDLALRRPHLREKEAQLAAAKSHLEKAEIDLSRTVIRSPFDAIVVSSKIEVGDYLTPQVEFAELAGTDMFRVQTSVPVTKLKWLMIPGTEVAEGSRVRVIQDIGISEIEREGRVLRLLGDLDPNGRMARVLVGVEDPLGIKHQYPFALLIGSYVRVEFEGPELEDVIVIPRSALREENKIWIYNDENKLDVRAVEVLFKDDNFVYIKNGIEEKEKIVVSPIAIPIPGMLLKAIEGDELDERG